MARFENGQIIIESGDTLSAIARELGISLNDLLAVVGDELRSGDPNLIFPGEVFTDPTAESSDGSDGTDGGGGGATEDGGGQTIGGNIFDPPVTISDEVTFPAGGTLVRVTNPEGSDAAVLNFVVFEVFGVQVAYEIGDDLALEETFGEFTFENVLTTDQLGFDEAGIVEVGLADELLGQEESVGSMFERELRLLGFEDIPAWIRGDEEALSMMMVAAREGWSPGRTARELSQTDAFAARFPSFAALQQQLGGTVLDTVDRYINLEDQYRALLRRHRGPNTDTSTEYLGQLIEIGWDPQEVSPILQAERVMRDNPTALDELNQLLAFNGLTAVDEVGFIDIMTDNAPPEVFEVINDAFRAAALLEEGIDIDTAFADALGGGSSQAILEPAGFSRSAQQIAAPPPSPATSVRSRPSSSGSPATTSLLRCSTKRHRAVGRRRRSARCWRG